MPPLGKEVSTGKGDCASTEIEGEEVPLRISQARLEGFADHSDGHLQQPPPPPVHESLLITIRAR